eukprot:m.339006 g.339006  ORF g.339006 m.339006 type:complete len:53 (-) comp18628_c0_seq1:975-1133(-)
MLSRATQPETTEIPDNDHQFIINMERVYIVQNIDSSFATSFKGSESQIHNSH